MTQYKNETISDQIELILTSITQEVSQSEKKIHLLDETTIQIKEQVYRVVKDYREGFNFEAFENRYQEYFEKFDFIVGDWGFEQLRLRGFYQLNKRKVPREQLIDYLDDYLKEYCNFGCRYFVLAKEEALLKYNQLTKGISNNITKKSSKAKINTRSIAEIEVNVPQYTQAKKKVKTSKKENFQIKQQLNNKKVINNVNPDVRKSSTTNKSKKNFIIKQLSK